MITLNLSTQDKIRHICNPLHIYCRIYKIVGKQCGKLVALTLYGYVYSKIERLIIAKGELKCNNL